MVRSLWTAASGMIAQQTSVDTISNNLANINSVGYKKETVEFKSLLYQTLQGKSTDSEGNPKPVGIQVGLGVRTAAITSQYTQGALNRTENTFDFAISGKGFFAVQLEDGSVGYTRDGSFQMCLGQDGLVLSDSAGHPVLDADYQPITVPANIKSSAITVDARGRLMYPDGNNNAQSMGVQIGLFQFPNPSGLEKGAGSILKQTAASGEAVPEGGEDTASLSILSQGYIEASNVQAVDEMVNMIVAQRAYEMNSKAITASDDMLRMANNLKQ